MKKKSRLFDTDPDLWNSENMDMLKIHCFLTIMLSVYLYTCMTVIMTNYCFSFALNDNDLI